MYRVSFGEVLDVQGSSVAERNNSINRGYMSCSTITAVQPETILIEWWIIT